MRALTDFHALPRDAAGNVPRVVLTGHQEVLVEQHRGLYSYDTDHIRIRTAQGLLSVTGQKLTIAYFGAQDLLIRGQVQSVQVESGHP